MSAIKRFQRFTMVMLTMLILVSAVSAVTAGNIIPSSRLDEYMSTITANTLKPVECSAITLTDILYCPIGGGNCDGTDASELVIGSSADDDIQSGKGADCVLGGAGNDSLRGEQNTDVCMGGPGTDGLHASCETGIQ
jgi:Ca2+-binding RTX toxin-like protein